MSGVIVHLNPRDPENVIDEVHELINYGADVNAENRFHDTPLHMAVRYGNPKLDIMKLLLKHGADIHAEDWHGDTPLHCAFNYRDHNLDVLSSCNRDIRFNLVHRFRNTELHNAVQTRLVEIDVVKLLLKSGANVNAKNWGSNSPLHFAVKFRNNGLDEIRLLIEHGAQINAQNLIGDTPLHKAVLKYGGKVEGIKELWKHGANFTIKNSTDETPLQLFMRECVVKQCEGTSLGDLDCAKFLIKCTLIQMSKKVNLETVAIEPSLKEFLTMFDKYLLTFYQECVSEIARMKHDMVVPDKSLYDLISVEDRIIDLKSKYVGNKNLVHQIFARLADNVYPLFSDCFITSILHRSDLFDKLGELQISSLYVECGKEKVIKLYSCSTLYIAKYLSDTDLINLILAIYGSRKGKMVKNMDCSTFPTEVNNDLKRSLSSFSGCCTKHARLESSCNTGFDFSYESKALTLRRYEQD